MVIGKLCEFVLPAGPEGFFIRDHANCVESNGGFYAPQNELFMVLEEGPAFASTWVAVKALFSDGRVGWFDVPPGTRARETFREVEK